MGEILGLLLLLERSEKLRSLYSKVHREIEVGTGLVARSALRRLPG